VRLFLDANVLFNAAHRPDGRSAALLFLAQFGRCTLIASPHAIEEARRNLAIKYPDCVARLAQLLRSLTVCEECSAENAAWARTQAVPDKDAPILGAAAQTDADLLITGDRTHFGHLYGKTLRGVRIVTPAQALL
jgi:predicted nucleic acid-binding protein